MLGRRDIEFAALYQAERRNAQAINVLKAVLAARDAAPLVSGGPASMQPVLQQTCEF